MRAAMPVLAALSAACAPASLPGGAAGPEPAGPGLGDTGDGAVEEVGGFGYLEGPAPELCAIRLDCGADIPDEPRITCSLHVEDAAGLVHYDGPAAVERRGRSSGSAPKHQYGVELRDEAGAEVERPLLGLPAESDWVLHGNYYDRALFRNKLTFDLYLLMGGTASGPRYAPRSLFCELWIDGGYEGIYSLTERIKRAEGRVPIAEDGGTGASFLVKDDEDYLWPNEGGYAGWKPIYPKPEEVDEARSAGISAVIGALNEAIVAGDAEAALSVVDPDALVDIVLIEEFAKNNDAWYLSLHAWKDVDGGDAGAGLLQFSPWDVDLAYGQPSYNDNENPESWILYRPGLPGVLVEGEGMHQRLAERWAELRAGVLSDASISALVDRYVETLEPGVDANFARWPIEEIDFGGYLYEVHSWDEEVERVRDWIARRLAWMDEHVADY